MKPDTDIRVRASGTGGASRRRGASRSAGGGAVGAPAGAWTFLTNHSHVLICLAADPDATIEEISHRVGITERSGRRIVGDLEAAGYLSRERVGRRNRYRFDRDRPLRHPIERHRTVRALLALVEAGR
jgi:hypothetical protein